MANYIPLVSPVEDVSAQTLATQVVEYSVRGTEYFTIQDASRGEIILIKKLDREKQAEHVFAIEAILPATNLTSYALVSISFN